MFFRFRRSLQITGLITKYTKATTRIGMNTLKIDKRKHKRKQWSVW